MKTVLFLASILLVSIALSTVCLTQDKGQGKKTANLQSATTVRSEGQKHECKVTRIDRNANTFAITGDGLQATIPFQHGNPPALGQRIHVEITCDDNGCRLVVEWKKQQ